MSVDDCRCAPVYAGHDVVGTNWSETCPAHGIGTDWFDVSMRERYEAFRRRLFPTLPASWTAEDDLPRPRRRRDGDDAR